MSDEQATSSITTDPASQDDGSRPPVLLNSQSSVEDVLVAPDDGGTTDRSSHSATLPKATTSGTLDSEDARRSLDMPGPGESRQLDKDTKVNKNENEKVIEIVPVPRTSDIDVRGYGSGRDDKEQTEGELSIREKIAKQEEEGLKRARALEEAVLGRHIEPKYTYDELRKTYKRVCEAVAEFELSASTLRTNSTALNLCKELVSRRAAAVFNTLKHFRPPPFPEVPVSLKTCMDEWVRDKEMEWKGAEDKALSSSSEWIHRSVLRRERLRELVPQWEQEHGQALKEMYRLPVHMIDRPGDKFPSVAKVRARCIFERSWQESRKRAWDDEKLGIDHDIELLDYNVYAYAWYETWSTLAGYGGPSMKADLKGLIQESGVEVGDKGREAVQKWMQKVQRLEVATFHFWKLTEKDSCIGEVPRSELKKRTEEEREAWQSAMEVEIALESAATRAGASSKWETSIGLLEQLELSDLPNLRHWWDGGWLDRTDDLRKWVGDHWQVSENPGEWNDRIDLQNWEMEIVLWWRNVKARMLDIEELQKICESVLKELEKIDGSASAREFNIFNKPNTAHVAHDVDRHHLLSDYMVGAKLAMGLGNERRFVRDFNAALDLVEGTLRSEVVKQGLATLIKKQDHFRNSFMDFATVAIFFSSITATTLQFSYQSADHTISSTIINLCWFASLVLSIASATNSLLGVLVHQSPEYLRPSQNADYQFLQNWFKYTPPTLLTVSGVLFLVGFCSFTFLPVSSPISFSGQGRAIQVVATSLTSANFLALLVIFLSAFWTTFRQAVLLHVIRFSTRFATLLIYFASLLVRLTYRLAMLSMLLFLALLALPFMTLYDFFRNKRFPPVYWKILFIERNFGQNGLVLKCRDELEKWQSTSTLCSYWRKLKISIVKQIQFFATRPAPVNTSLPLENVVTES